MISQAIHDGVIDATINHEEGYVASKEVVDVYATGEPQEAFHKRIAFCLKMHNDSVMGLRFPPNAFRKYLQSTEVRRAHVEATLASGSMLAPVCVDLASDFSHALSFSPACVCV